MRKRIFIHIGAHKTGTTTLQQFFRNAHRPLEERGFLYPMSASFHFAQHRLPFSLRGWRDPEHGDVPAFAKEGSDLVREIADSECPSVIISSEELLSVPADGVAALGELFKDHDVRVVAVLRRPDILFESIYNQKVKEPKNRFFRPYRAFLDEPTRISDDLKFDTVLGNWAKVFGAEAMMVRCLVDDEDVVGLVADAVGFDRKGLPEPPERRNVSVSVKTAELIRLGKVAGLGEPQLRKLLALGNEVFAQGDKSESLLAPQERMQILRMSDRATGRVFRKYMKGENLYSSERFSRSDFPEKSALMPAEIVGLFARLLPGGEK